MTYHTCRLVAYFNRQLSAKLRTMEVKKAILKSWGVYIWLLAVHRFQGRGLYWHLRQLKELPKHSQVYISPVKKPSTVFAAGCVCAWGCWLTNISSTALGCPCPCPISDRCQGNHLRKCTMNRTRNLIQVMNCIFFSSLIIFQMYPFPNVDLPHGSLCTHSEIFNNAIEGQEKNAKG